MHRKCSVVGLRYRALISVMGFTLGRRRGAIDAGIARRPQ
jgi:hypothetical protein